MVDGYILLNCTKRESLFLCGDSFGVVLASDAQEDEISKYPQGLVLVPRASEESVVVGPHIRGSRLRASAAGFEEVDLLLPGTAR